MTLYKVATEWQGFPGSPGYTNFYFQGTGDGIDTSAQECVDKVAAFWTRALSWLAPGVQLRISGEVERIDPATGMLEAYVAATPPAAMTSSNAGPYSASSGACITWTTGGIRNGRRMRGRTFLVPLDGDSYDNTGTLDTNALADITTAAGILADPAGPDLMIWGRPTSKGAGDGVAHWVTSWRVADKAAVLRSRRD